MTITTYQIRNVLRTYGNQLKRRANTSQDVVFPIQSSADLVDISIEARKRQVLSQLSSKLIAQVTAKNRDGGGSGGDGLKGDREMAFSDVLVK